MQRTVIFANNLRALLAHQGLTPQEASLQWGIKQDVLQRWVAAGVSHPHKLTMTALEQLATQFGFDELWMLWEPWTPGNDGPDTAARLLEDVERRLDGMGASERAKAIYILKGLIDGLVSAPDQSPAESAAPSLVESTESTDEAEVEFEEDFDFDE